MIFLIPIPKTTLIRLNKLSDFSKQNVEFIIEYALGFSFFSPDNKFVDILANESYLKQELDGLEADLSPLSIEICKSLKNRYVNTDMDLLKIVVVSVNIALIDYLDYMDKND